LIDDLRMKANDHVFFQLDLRVGADGGCSSMVMPME